MYAAPHFREERPEVLLDAIRDIGAVTLVTRTADDLSATFIPVLVGGTVEAPMLIGHIARANLQWKRALPDEAALAVAAGPNTYVSPSLYPSKAKDPRVVPTWNYVHVQAHGQLEWVTDAEQKLAIVSMLTDHHEAQRDAPWAVSDAPDDFVEAKLAGIVGVRLTVERLEGSFKLSQNQDDTNRLAVEAGLEGADTSRGRDVAAAMAERQG